MSEKFEMVVVDGVRYRPEHAPKKKVTEPEEKAVEKPVNKSQTVKNK